MWKIMKAGRSQRQESTAGEAEGGRSKLLVKGHVFTSVEAPKFVPNMRIY